MTAENQRHDEQKCVGLYSERVRRPLNSKEKEKQVFVPPPSSQCLSV